MFVCWYNVNWMFDSLLRSCIITLAWAFVGLASKNLMSPSDCFCCEIIERFHPSANNRPSEILTTCLHCLLIVSLCVTIKMLADRGAASIKIVTLLDKPARRRVELKADYYCFIIPDEFVVGYGLDYDEKYRNLPDIGVLHPRIYGGE